MLTLEIYALRSMKMRRGWKKRVMTLLLCAGLLVSDMPYAALAKEKCVEMCDEEITESETEEENAVENGDIEKPDSEVEALDGEEVQAENETAEESESNVAETNEVDSTEADTEEMEQTVEESNTEESETFVEYSEEMTEDSTEEMTIDELELVESEDYLLTDYAEIEEIEEDVDALTAVSDPNFANMKFEMSDLKRKEDNPRYVTFTVKLTGLTNPVGPRHYKFELMHRKGAKSDLIVHMGEKYTLANGAKFLWSNTNNLAVLNYNDTSDYYMRVSVDSCTTAGAGANHGDYVVLGTKTIAEKVKNPDLGGTISIEGLGYTADTANFSLKYEGLYGGDVKCGYTITRKSDGKEIANFSEKLPMSYEKGTTVKSYKVEGLEGSTEYIVKVRLLGEDREAIATTKTFKTKAAATPEPTPEKPEPKPTDPTPEKPEPTNPDPTDEESEKVSVTVDTPVDYTGAAIKPTVNVFYKNVSLKEGKDYTLSYKNNTNVYTGTDDTKKPQVIVTLKGNLTGKLDPVYFEIKPLSLPKNVNIDFKTDYTAVYDGKKHVPGFTLKTKAGKKLVLNKDYEISLKEKQKDGKSEKVTATTDETEIADYIYTVKGINNYADNLESRCKINLHIIDGSKKIPISKATVKYTKQVAYGTKSSDTVKESIKVAYGKKALTNGTDYTVTVPSVSSMSVGKHYITITGIGDYAGTAQYEVQVTGIKLTASMFDGKLVDFIYDGSNRWPLTNDATKDYKYGLYYRKGKADEVKLKENYVILYLLLERLEIKM